MSKPTERSHKMSMVMNELVEAGLITSNDDPHLSDKGREWMHELENIDHHELELDGAADLILSTNGLFR